MLRSMRSGTIVLGYHGVAIDEEIHDPWVQRSQTALSEFRAHLEFIGNNFEVASADETLEQSSRKRRIHLSFDDGYVGFADHAVPLLNEYGFPASVYVVTDALTDETRLPPYIGRAALGHCEPGELTLDSIRFKSEITDRNSRLAVYSEVSMVLKTGNSVTSASLVDELIALIPNDQWTSINQKYNTDSLMPWETLRKVSDAGFTVGAHTKSHLSLSDKQAGAEIENEVAGSVNAVRQELGSCDWFAYPNGTIDDWSLAAAAAVKNAGVKGAWTLEPGVIRNPSELNPHRLPRFSVPRSQDRFTLLLNMALVQN